VWELTLPQPHCIPSFANFPPQTNPKSRHPVYNFRVSTQSVISTTPHYLPQGEVLSPESQPIQDLHRELVSAARALRSCLAKVSYYGWRMRLCEGWTALAYPAGSKGEEAYAESIGIPRSTWYRHVRIGQLLHQLTYEDLERIPTTNAELLIQVNPAICHDFNWTREAQVLKPNKFAELVAQRNKAAGDDREPLASLVLKVPFLAKQAVESMIEDFQHKHQLNSKGQALELMIADRSQDASLLSSVHQARQLLVGVEELMKQRGAEDSDEIRWIHMAKEILDESYEKTVQAARSKPEGRKATGGRA